jgi:SprT protein
MTDPRTLAMLRPFLPEGTEPFVAGLLARHACHIRLARPRRTKLGDHRPPGRAARLHRISINQDLNPYAFLTTLLHEIAHAATWDRHERHRRRRLRPHGAEWRDEYAAILRPVVALGVLPEDVAVALERSLARPAAATCSDRGLLVALGRHDRVDPRLVRVEEVAVGGWFRLDTGAVFRAGRTLRTRRQCFEARTGAEYRVHGLARVEPVPPPAVSGSAGRPVGRRSGRCG